MERELERRALEEAYENGFLVWYRLPWEEEKEEEKFPYEEWEEEVRDFFFWEKKDREEEEEKEEKYDEWIDEHWLRRV
jgi:hypothetical protein